MLTDWTSLERELDLWSELGLTLPLWWRDDDATQPTQALGRLNALSDKLSFPVHIAVIPATAGTPLADYMGARTNLIPLVHGLSHSNHEPQGVKSSEFGTARLPRNALADAAQSRELLEHLFGPRLCPVFVPPWNRIAPEVVAGLPSLGFTMLSASGPRKARFAAPGLEQVNIHLDPINWRGDRSAVPTARLIEALCADLADRRTGKSDNTEPYGILTHHLVHDEAIWQVTTEILQRLIQGPSEPWTAPEHPNERA